MQQIRYGRPASCSLMQPSREILIPFCCSPVGTNWRNARGKLSTPFGRPTYLQSWPRNSAANAYGARGPIDQGCSRMRRTAVVIYNLGGPDSPEAVRPFLKNLFSDPMILRVPAPVRWFLSQLISWRRTPVAREIYAEIGEDRPYCLKRRSRE